MSQNVSNSSATQPQGASMYPTMSASAFGPQYTPGPVNMTYQPFSTPNAVPMGAIPFSSPDLRRANLTCQMVTVNGLEQGMGCTVTRGGETMNVDLSGTNPYTFSSGANRITVMGDPQTQMCNVSYSDNFDTASFNLQPNGRFESCI